MVVSLQRGSVERISESEPESKIDGDVLDRFGGGPRQRGLVHRRCSPSLIVNTEEERELGSRGATVIDIEFVTQVRPDLPRERSRSIEERQADSERPTIYRSVVHETDASMTFRKEPRSEVRLCHRPDKEREDHPVVG